MPQTYAQIRDLPEGWSIAAKFLRLEEMHTRTTKRGWAAATRKSTIVSGHLVDYNKDKPFKVLYQLEDGSFNTLCVVENSNGVEMLVLLQSIDLEFSQAPAEKVIIVVEGGLVEGVTSTADLDVLILDKDIEGRSADELALVDGEPCMVNFTSSHIHPEITLDNWAQAENPEHPNWDED